MFPVRGIKRRIKADPGPETIPASQGPGVEIDGDLGGWKQRAIEPRRHLPEGIGRSLPKRSRCRSCRSTIIRAGNRNRSFPDRSPLLQSRCGETLHWSAAIKLDLKIPANDGNYKAEAFWPVPLDLEAWAVTPLMHLLGKSMSMSLKFPDGRTQDLIKIGDWDFGWQNTYFFKQPITLPKGTVADM